MSTEGSPLFFYLVFLYFQPGTAADNLHPLHPNRNVPENDCGGSGRGRYYDVFTRISYYRGWIQRVVEQRYDGEPLSFSLGQSGCGV